MSNGSTTSQQQGDGGFVVTPEMKRLLAIPGHISERQGAQRLRNLYQDQAMNFDPTRLSEFALACFVGQLDAVQEAIKDGTAPDLKGSETPYKFGYAAFVISGSQRLVSGPGMRHADTLKFLLAAGATPDVEDIVGYTALHHATMKEDSKVDLARILLEHGADPNHQTRYGAVPLLDCFQTNQVECVDLLMEFGADLSIADADGIVPSRMYLSAGPKIAALIAKWMRKRNGEDALLDEKKCRGCGHAVTGLKQCGKCHTVRYCSANCQRKDWPVHKITCKPLNATNTVTLTPRYNGLGNLFSTSDFTRRAMGIPTEPTPSRNNRSAHAPRSSAFPKSVIIKVQVPYAGYGMPTTSTADLLIYTKKRDFVCTVAYADDKDAYKCISEVVRERGVGGAKAYFAAELKGRDELVVKIDEVLAAQPF